MELSGPVKIKVIAVGGGGGNALNEMIRQRLHGVEFIAVNTDKNSLKHSLAAQKLQIGEGLTKGMGAGCSLRKGRQAALEDIEKLKDAVSGADMVIIVAGMGGGTGTGAAPVIAQVAKEIGVLTLGVVSLPFSFEGKKRFQKAKAGIDNMLRHSHSVIAISCEECVQDPAGKKTFVTMLMELDTALYSAVRGILLGAQFIVRQVIGGRKSDAPQAAEAREKPGFFPRRSGSGHFEHIKNFPLPVITDLIMAEGLIGIDFADVNAIFKSQGGLCLMAEGKGSGALRAHDAAAAAIACWRRTGVPLETVRAVVMRISLPTDGGIDEVSEAANIISEHIHGDAKIFFQAMPDHTAGTEMSIIMIGVGLEVFDDDRGMNELAPGNTSRGNYEESDFIFDDDDDLYPA